MITAQQLLALREAMLPVLQSSTFESMNAKSLEAYDYPARLRTSLIQVIALCEEGIKSRGPKEVAS
jgi:hypothetical protein